MGQGFPGISELYPELSLELPSQWVLHWLRPQEKDSPLPKQCLEKPKTPKIAKGLVSAWELIKSRCRNYTIFGATIEARHRIIPSGGLRRPKLCGNLLKLIIILWLKGGGFMYFIFQS